MNLTETLWENLKEPLWERGKYMEYLDEISAYKSVKNDRASEQADIKTKMQDLSEICYDITVDMGYSSHEETMVTISMPYSNLRYLSVTNKNKEEKNMGFTGIPWKETFSEEEKNMPLSAYCDAICKRLNLTTKTPSVIPYCDETYEGFGSKTKTPTPAYKPKWLEGLPAVKKVETYNDRVVKVTFIDGTFTKAVCSENDNFDLDVGITICAMKRLLGTNSDNATREYNRFINHVHSVMEKNTLDEVAEEARQAKEKSRQRKAELKKAAKKLKVKEEAIDIQKQAIIRAHQEMEAMGQ